MKIVFPILRTALKHARCFFFVFGILIGITLGCTFTLLIVTGWKTTYYYYNGEGAAPVELKSPTNKMLPVQYIKATDQVNHLSKRSESEEDDNIQDVLADMEKQSHMDPNDTPNWYNSELVAKYNSQASFKYNENFWLHRKDVLISLFMKNCDEILEVPLLLDTWGGTVDVMILIDSKCIIPVDMRRPFVIQLPELSLYTSYPHQKKTPVLRYTFEKYGHAYNWFLFLTDVNTYINVKYLQQYVYQLNYDEPYYIGNPKRLTIEELKKYRLYQHEQFCQSRLGILLSKKMLLKLIPLLDTCSKAHSSMMVVDEDIELGRCISRKLGMQCWSGSKEQNKLFYLDSEGELSENPGSIFDNQLYSDVLSIHPIKTDAQMHITHFYYGMLEYNRTKILMVSLGKTVNHLCQSLSKYFTSSPKLRSILKHCNVNFKKDLADIEEEETFDRFIPKDIHEVQSWDYFDSKSIYEDKTVEPRKVLAIHKYHKQELEDVLLEIVRLANLEYPSPLVFHNLINGYVRHNGLKGNEYIIDAEFTESNNPYVIVQRRFTLLRPLSSSYVLKSSKNTIDELVTVLVPISHVTDRLDEFLLMYENIALIEKEHTRLALVVFKEDDNVYCKSKIKAISRKYPQSKFMVIQGSGEFARAKALHQGMTVLERNSLVFISDVDMTIDEFFLNRCRRNTIKGKQAYYPEMFKWYNKDYVYKFKWIPHQQKIARDTGHWAYYSYGMLCIYQSDYMTTGGFDTRIVGWGGEDVKFYKAVLKSNLEVIRAPDPGLTHRWHDKKCVYIDHKRYQNCLSSKAEMLADRKELAQYIFEIEEKKKSVQFFGL